MSKLGMHRVFYDPAAAVQHIIPTERLRPEWFRRRVYWQAVSDLASGQAPANDAALWREYGDTVAQLEARHRNLLGLTFEPADYPTFKLQLRAIYLAQIVLGHGGVGA